MNDCLKGERAALSGIQKRYDCIRAFSSIGGTNFSTSVYNIIVPANSHDAKVIKTDSFQ